MFTNTTLWTVASVFFRQPSTEFTIADLKRETKLTYPSLKPKLDALAAQHLITWTSHTKETRSYKLYKANNEHSEYRYWKRIHNALSLKLLVDYLEETCKPDVIVLFGSYARGEDDEHSDIDLFIQTKKRTLDLRQFEKVLGKEIQYFTEPDIGNFPDSLQQNLRSGVVIHGTFTTMTRQQHEQDKPLANHMRSMTTRDLEVFNELPKGFPSMRLRLFYDALRAYAEAYGIERGIRFRGEGAHYDLFEYLREERAITEDERIFLQDLRDTRNKNTYEGKDVPEDYLERKTPEINRLLGKLRNL